MAHVGPKAPSYFFLPVAWVVFLAAGFTAFAGDDFPVDFAFFISQSIKNYSKCIAVWNSKIFVG
jgi:hypothetical protein